MNTGSRSADRPRERATGALRSGRSSADRDVDPVESGADVVPVARVSAGSHLVRLAGSARGASVMHAVPRLAVVLPTSVSTGRGVESAGGVALIAAIVDWRSRRPASPVRSETPRTKAKTAAERAIFSPSRFLETAPTMPSAGRHWPHVRRAAWSRDASRPRADDGGAKRLESSIQPTDDTPRAGHALLGTLSRRRGHC
jgi:hypothetical protein